MRHDSEILTDNTQIRYCEQCRECTLWGIGNDPFQNSYDKTSCAMFPYPDRKPLSVINNQGPCPFRVAKE